MLFSPFTRNTFNLNTRSTKFAAGMLAVLSLVWGSYPEPHEIQGMLLIAAALALLSYLGVRQHRKDDPLLGRE